MLFIILTPAVAFPISLDSLNSNIDATNEYIATKWDELNRSVDTFFTNKRSQANENKSSIFVYASYAKKESVPFAQEYEFQLKFDLPNTTKKLKIVIEKQQDEISSALSDTSVTQNKEVITKNGKVTGKKETHYTAGANYVVSKSQSVLSLVHFGIRLDMPLNPVLKFDVSKEIKTKPLNIILSQKMLLYRQEGFQEISQLTLNKKINKDLQVDLVNSLAWTNETDALLLRNNLIFSHSVGDEKSLTYSIGANAVFSPVWNYDSYDASVSYRQLLYHDWFYGTLTLGADFPKAENFNDNKLAQVRFDIYFKE